MTALLELAGVRKAFGSVVVADDLSFRLGAGEALGIVGPNGAGKTSMLNLISGTLNVDDGRIVFDGSDITALPAHRRARLGIGRTHQVPRPFAGMSVFENVLLAATQAGAARAGRDDPAQIAAGLLDQLDLMPVANRAAGALTLLERKLLELARALSIRPRVLLLDEIAGGLFEPEVHQLVEYVRGLRASGIAIIWIEHVVQALVSAVDRLIAMDYGRVLADGPPTAVITDSAVQAVYLGQEMEMVEL
jgi:branched-chain amino acid transport system ATP-binding protein